MVIESVGCKISRRTEVIRYAQAETEEEEGGFVAVSVDV